MDLWQVVRLLLRRWYVAVPLLLLTAVAALQAGDRVQPTYSARADILLTTDGGTAVEGAPAGSDAINVVTATQAMIVSLNSPESRRRAAEQGRPPDYVLTQVSRTSLVRVTAEDDSAAGSLATVQGVLETIPEELNARPEVYGEAPGSTIAVTVLATPAIENETYTGRSRVLAVTIVIGGLLTALTCLAVDLWLNRRRRPTTDSRLVVQNLVSRARSSTARA